MTEDELAADGWQKMDDDPLPGGLGTPWRKRLGESWIYGFQTRPDHANPAGVLHGGMLMLFADHTLGCYVEEAAKGAPNVTIQLNTHFLGAVQPGQFLALRGEVTRATGSLVFVRGTVSADGADIGAFDGIWRYFRRAEAC